MNQDNYKYSKDLGNYSRTADVTGGERSAAEASRTFMNRVYNWMTVGLAVTGIVAWLLYQYMQETKPMSDSAGNLYGGSIFWSPGFMLVMVLVELGLVFWLSLGINKMSPGVAGFCFLLYAAISGITLSPIFMVYTQSAISAAFFTCAGTFAVTSIFGYLTRMDLSGIGSFCMMGLFGLIIASLVNMFLKNAGFDRFLTYIGVIIFVGLTAWDTQRLKQMGSQMSETGEMYQKYAIIGALELYLDFINLFIMLLKLFGRRD